MQQRFCTNKMANYVPRLICRLKNRIFLRPNVSLASSYVIQSRSESTLILSGKKAGSTFVYLNPKIDCDSQLSNVKEFQKEIKLRGLNINIQEKKYKWMKLKEAFISVQNIEIKKNYIIDMIKHIREQENKTQEDEQKLITLKKEMEMAIIKLKEAQNIFWDLQDSILPDLFQLPNRLDACTSRMCKVLTTYGKLRPVHDSNRKCHLEIGKQLGLLEYRDPINYYLCDDAVLFELGVLEYAANILRDTNMLRVAGCDFSRSVTIEGIGLDHEDPLQSFILSTEQNISKHDPNKLHLVGGASMIGILNLFVKTLLNKNDFPIRCFSTGRQYVPYPDSSVNNGLFMACQSSIIQAFIAIGNPKSLDYQTAFDELVSTTTQIYKDICDHFRVVLRPARELKYSESKRVSFEVWSTYARCYVEVGHVSAYGDYLSKRLLISYKEMNEHQFPGIISGTIVSVPRLLACLLERNPEKFEMPSKLQETSIFKC